MQTVTATITMGGTAQTALATYTTGATPYLFVQNQSTGLLMFTIDGSTASATNGIKLLPDAFFEWPNSAVPTTQISIWGATAGQQFFAARA